MPRRLCIVSGNLLRCDAFIPALSALSRDDELEIIVDRRRAVAASEGARPPAEERRSRPYLDLALKVDGFAIVPWSPTPPVPAPALAPPPAPATPPAPAPPAFTPTPTPSRLSASPSAPADSLDDEIAPGPPQTPRSFRFTLPGTSG